MKTTRHLCKKENTQISGKIPCLWIGRVNIVKMSILSKATYRFNIFPIKIPMTFFTGVEKIILRLVLNQKKKKKKSFEEPKQF